MMNARSMFGIAAVAALYSLLKSALDLRPATKRRLSSGALGVETKEKYEWQASGDWGLWL